MENIIQRMVRWHRRAQEPGLSVLLVLEILLVFMTIPLSGLGEFSFHFRVFNMAVTLGLMAGCAVVSRHPVVLAAVLVCIIALNTANYLRETIPSVATVYAYLATCLVFLILVTAVVGHAVFASGRVTLHRVQGAIVIYLHVALTFAILYQMVALFAPNAFNPPIHALELSGPSQFLYFSLVTLTSTGYGDIVPVHSFARSLANLEAVIGQLFPATLIARLVTLESHFSTKNSD